jgi:hypothetical protein
MPTKLPIPVCPFQLLERTTASPGSPEKPMPPPLTPVPAAVPLVESTRAKVMPSPPVPPFCWAVKAAVRPSVATAVL